MKYKNIQENQVKPNKIHLAMAGESTAQTSDLSKAKANNMCH